MLSKFRVAFSLLLLALLRVDATFSDGFQSFLTRQYGSTVSKQLTRSDLGINGSFGGNFFSFPIRIFRDPVVFVHGLNNTAGGLLDIRNFFYHQGYGNNELYATSYGPQGKVVDASSAISCDYIKQVRQLITAVSAYTGGKRVVVATYSLGAPIARKAILGGQCVDTKENLGSPLTKTIAAFLSVAGANLGAIECNQYPTAPICSATNGFKSGSAFLRDINSQRGYEGQARYSIGSQADDIVGFTNLSLPAAQINVTLTDFNHGDTCLNTINTQYYLISQGYVTQETVNKDTYAESKLIGRNCTGSVSGGDTFQFGPHVSQQQLRGAGSSNNDYSEYHGEYNHQAKVFTFVSGLNYTRHTNPSKGNYFKTNNNGQSMKKN